jgi:hypothetical protein
MRAGRDGLTRQIARTADNAMVKNMVSNDSSIVTMRPALSIATQETISLIRLLSSAFPPG